MPIHKVKGGYKWGKHGKTYPKRADAAKQARAAYANGYREPKSLRAAVEKGIKDAG